MESASVVDAARQSLGPVGVYVPVPFTSAPPVSLQREAVTRLERAGYRTAWVNETVGGKDPQQAAAVGREWTSPLAAMRDYLERMAAPTMTPAPEASYARIVAANGPKMIALARDMADGMLPAGLPPAFTAQARGGTRPGQAARRRAIGDHRYRRPRNGTRQGGPRDSAAVGGRWR